MVADNRSLSYKRGYGKLKENKKTADRGSYRYAGGVWDISAGAEGDSEAATVGIATLRDGDAPAAEIRNYGARD